MKIKTTELRGNRANGYARRVKAIDQITGASLLLRETDYWQLSKCGAEDLHAAAVRALQMQQGTKCEHAGEMVGVMLDNANCIWAQQRDTLHAEVKDADLAIAKKQPGTLPALRK